MVLGRSVAASVVVAVGLAAPAAVAQERATVSPMNSAARYAVSPPAAVRANPYKPQWVIAPSPQWPEQARDVAQRVTVSSECSISNAGRLRDCRIVDESIAGKGFGQEFLRALSKARVETATVRIDTFVFRTTATFDPPAAGTFANR